MRCTWCGSDSRSSGCMPQGLASAQQRAYSQTHSSNDEMIRLLTDILEQLKSIDARLRQGDEFA